MHARAKSIIPPLSPHFHKGQAGRIGVVGGCFEYTGAPFYASVSSLHVGGDLSFILCSKNAATPIKSYSPEVIVYPVLPDEDDFDTSTTTQRNKDMDEIMTRVNSVTSSLFKRIHTLVIGPGLGRGTKMMECAIQIINQAKDYNLPMVLDGDALFLLTKNPNIIKGYRRAVLTPNHVEFKRLCNAMNAGSGDQNNETDEFPEKAKQLSKSLGGTTLLVKGPKDTITDGDQLEEVTEPGSARRCGGQGDVLAGATGTFLHWGITHHLREESGETDIIAAAYGAALVTRTASFLATIKGKRFTTTPDIIKELGEAFKHHFPDV